MISTNGNEILRNQELDALSKVKRGERETYKELKREIHVVVFMISVVIACIVSLALYISSFQSYSSSTKGRRLDASSFLDGLTTSFPECKTNNTLYDPLDLTMEAAAPLYMLGIIFTTLWLSIVTDHFFFPSMEAIVRITNMREDVAGATILAAGTSMPDVISAMIGVYFPEDSGAGIGTVAGSLVCNMLLIIAICCFVAPDYKLKIGGFTVLRESFFYLLSVVALLLALRDRRIQWFDPFSFILGYIVYVIVCSQSVALEMYCRPLLVCLGLEQDVDLKSDVNVVNVIVTPSQVPAPVTSNAVDSSTIDQLSSPLLSIKGMPDNDSDAQEPHDRNIDGNNTRLWSPRDEGEENILEDTCTHSFMKYVCHLRTGSDGTSSAFHILTAVVEFLPRLLFWLTIPSCEYSAGKQWRWPGTFIMSLAWIGIICFVMIKWIEKSGCILDVYPSTLGLTVSAAGSCLPNILAAVIATKNGKGSMAISSVYGANTFSILVGLGLPWALGMITHPTVAIIIDDDGIVMTSFLLLVILFFSIVSFIVRKFTLTLVDGYLHLALYFAYLLYVILQDQGMLGTL